MLAQTLTRTFWTDHSISIFVNFYQKKEEKRVLVSVALIIEALGCFSVYHVLD